MKFNRRFILKSAVGTLFLPDLMASEIETPTPQRAVFMSMGFGVNATWFPKRDPQDLSLSSSLAPLNRHRQDLSFAQNLSFMQRYNPHYASTIYLTGENVFRVPGAVQNSVSCDQMIAKKLEDECRFPSLSVSSKLSTEAYGHGAGVSSLSVDWSGRYIPGILGPLNLYNYIFGQHKISPEQIKQQLENKKSLLDYYTDEVKRSQKSLASSGKVILEEYTDSIRDLEKRLSHAIKWSHIPYPKVDYKQPKPDVSASDEVLLTYELIALALKFDLTRVITYALPCESLLKEMNAPINTHSMSHYERSDTAHDRDLLNSKFFAHFLDKLKEVKTADGKNLLHHSIVSLGAGVRHGHGTKDVPMIVAGNGGGKFKQGQNVILQSNKTDVCELWYTILNSFDNTVNEFKTGKNLIKEIHT